MYAYTFINAYSHCAQSCLTLCDPMDCGPLGSSVHGISQTAGDLLDPGIKPSSLPSPASAGGFFTFAPPVCVLCLVAQSCLTLCNPMDCQAPLSMVILQARILDGLLLSPPGDLPNPRIKPRYRSLQADSLPSEPPGKPAPPGKHFINAYNTHTHTHTL